VGLPTLLPLAFAHCRLCGGSVSFCAHFVTRTRSPSVSRTRPLPVVCRGFPTFILTFKTNPPEICEGFLQVFYRSGCTFRNSSLRNVQRNLHAPSFCQSAAVHRPHRNKPSGELTHPYRRRDTGPLVRACPASDGRAPHRAGARLKGIISSTGTATSGELVLKPSSLAR
jgi:hypothetical protein